MIAEAEVSTIETTGERPKNKPSYRNGEIPVLLRVKARNLYLHQSLPYKAISEVTGLPVKTLEQLSFREKWSTIRKANYQRLTKSADARTSAMAEEVAEAIASHSEQHALRALQKTGDALERNDRDAAKDAQAYSSTVKNLAGVAKAMREPMGSSANVAPTQFNIFFAAPAQAQKPAEPKQVTEIEVTKS